MFSSSSFSSHCSLLENRISDLEIELTNSRQQISKLQLQIEEQQWMEKVTLTDDKH